MVYKSVYAVLFVPIGALYFASNVILTPFAFVKNVYYKIRLVRCGVISMLDLLYYVLVGLPMALYATIPDLWAFTQASWLIEKPYNSEEVFVIGDGMFSIFYRML